MNRASNEIFEATSFLNGTNAAYVEQMYAAWLANPLRWTRAGRTISPKSATRERPQPNWAVAPPGSATAAPTLPTVI
jgi:2-oxoglutarate dehydrogenase complex dehydrogenase (E1) component-like enzyme